jgi:hypothetical protein
LSTGDGGDVALDDLAAMLRPLRQLRTLLLLLFMLQHVTTALRVVGAASPGLRHLDCFLKLALEEADEPDEPADVAPSTLLFPHLEYIHTRFSEADGDDHAR